MTVPEPAALSPKAEQTRRAIVDSAMRLFRTKGYDKATMRSIATEAGVSLGNAYYYFGSKEHLVQAFYDQLQAEHADAAEKVLARDSRFDQRLLGVLHFLNVYVFNAIRRRSRMENLRSAPVPPQGFTPPVAAYPR